MDIQNFSDIEQGKHFQKLGLNRGR